jgi:hypothetical protein
LPAASRRAGMLSCDPGVYRASPVRTRLTTAARTRAGARIGSLPARHLELPEESDQRLFFLRGELCLENQVEELDRIFERQQTAVMEIGR